MTYLPRNSIQLSSVDNDSLLFLLNIGRASPRRERASSPIGWVLKHAHLSYPFLRLYLLQLPLRAMESSLALEPELTSWWLSWPVQYSWCCRYTSGIRTLKSLHSSCLLYLKNLNQTVGRWGLTRKGGLLLGPRPLWTNLKPTASLSTGISDQTEH